MATDLDKNRLADLLRETGERHHQAYLTTEGVDPEWALWYAGYLQAAIWDRLGAPPTRSSLVHLLLEAEQRFEPSDQAPDWPSSYAAFLLDHLSRA